MLSQPVRSTRRRGQHFIREVKPVRDLSPDQTENLENLTHGQIVLVTARWILIASSLLFVLWEPDPIGTLRIQILLLLGLAIANFYLHGQVLMKRTVQPWIVYAASICDLIVVSAVVAVEDSFASNTFVFFFPAIVVYSVVFESMLTAAFTGAACLAYALECMFTGSYWLALDRMQVLFTRIVMMIAVAVVANLFARIERTRREEAQIARQELLDELGNPAGAAEPVAEMPAQSRRS